MFIATPKGEWLYKLLRPEFVASYEKPLSSDAFSAFGIHDHALHNAEVVQATTHLMTRVIPRLAASLLATPPFDGTNATSV